MAKSAAKQDHMELVVDGNLSLELAPGDQHTAGHLAAEGPLREVAMDMATETDLVPLMRTSVMIALALSVHNLPEGLASFVG
jgi:zinc transporter ZupT